MNIIFLLLSFCFKWIASPFQWLSDLFYYLGCDYVIQKYRAVVCTPAEGEIDIVHPMYEVVDSRYFQTEGLGDYQWVDDPERASHVGFFIGTLIVKQLRRKEKFDYQYVLVMGSDQRFINDVMRGPYSATPTTAISSEEKVNG